MRDLCHVLRPHYVQSVLTTSVNYAPIQTSRGPFLEAPGNYRARYLVLFFILDSSFKRFENCTVKLSAKETKWTSLEVRTHPTFLENFISKYDFGPVKFTGLSRNGPLVR